MHTLWVTLLTTGLSVILAACSPPGSDPTKVDLADLVGLWNSSEKMGPKTDVVYTRVSSDGAIIEYDFDGDDVDQGLNCYQIDSGHIRQLQGNRFLVTADMHAIEQFEVELELLDAGNALKIYFIDSNDIDADNDRTETYKSQIWTRESDATMLDKEPSCQQR